MRGLRVCLSIVRAVSFSPATSRVVPCRALRGCRPMTLLDEVVGLLAADAIPHALIGAAALAVRGIARSTFDIDLLTTDRRVFAPERWAPLVRAGATVDIRHGDAEDPLAGVIRITSAGARPVDVIVGRHAWQGRAVARAEPGVDAPPVVTAVDLVLLKLYAGGTQDLWDVRELLRGTDAEALIDAVDRELRTLPTAMRAAWSTARA